MNSTKNKQEASTKLKKLQDEEKELVAAVAKLKNIKNKLKVEELALMAELRERSMQAAQVMSQSGVDLTAVANEASAPRSAAASAAAAASVATVSGWQPELQLDVPTNRGYEEEEEEDDDDEDDF